MTEQIKIIIELCKYERGKTVILLILIPIIICLILVIMSKMADIIVGGLLVIGGFAFNAYLDTADSLEFKLEAVQEGITNLPSYSNTVIAVGVVLIIIGIVRFIVKKKKPETHISNNA